MKKNDLKKLASITIENGIVNEKVQKFVLEKLSRNDLKQYLFFLRNELASRKVTVKSPTEPGTAAKSVISGIFEGKSIQYETSGEIGAGIQIEFSDNILHYHIKNLIERTVNSVKETL
jgi:hypothetical protein